MRKRPDSPRPICGKRTQGRRSRAGLHPARRARRTSSAALAAERRAGGPGFLSGRLVPLLQPSPSGFQRRLADIRALGAQFVAISPQLPSNPLSTQEKNELAFPVLSDVGNKVARQFGIVFELSDKLLKLYRQFGHALEDFNGETGKKELPVPGTFLLDSKGIVRLAHVDVDYTHRLRPG